jgi:vancomycin resistance protein YoaR
MPDSLTLAAEAPLRRRRTSAAVAAVAIVLAIAAAAIVVVEAAGFGERIPAGVRVDGVPVGGLTPDEASSLLRMRARMRDSRPLTLVGPLRTVATSGAALGAQAQIDQALAEASAGRVGLIRHLLGIGEARAVPLRFAFPRASIEQLAARLGATSAVDATVTVEAGRPRVRPARPGRVVDADALETGLTTLPSRLRVPSVETAPLVTTQAARAAAERAARLVAQPRTIVVGRQEFDITAEDLRAALRIRRVENGFVVGFDPQRLGTVLPRPTRPRDARLVVEGERVRVAPSEPGRAVDAATLAVALTDPTKRTIQAGVDLVRPRVTTADLAALRIREQVSSFTTYYPPGQPRVTNIQRAASVIDGTILRPGGTFSMNQVLGERTIEKGYVAAPQIVGTSFAESVGGGISQVATTLYNGAFFAGLELTEHQPHSLYIDRYPLGREATISWGGPELIFRNDWPAGVLIDVKAGDTSITVRFFSSRLGRRVATQTSMPNGNGGGGFTVEYTRRVYRGTELRRDEHYGVSYGVASVHGR